MANRHMFRSASLRLTAIYLVIIMVISLLFSLGLYKVSSDELERGLLRPFSNQERRLLIGKGEGGLEILKAEREQELQESRQRLRSSLVVLNLLILLSGGGLSYYLARRTLKPIEEAHDAQGRFTADASHELRTPITAMRAETELTLTEPKLTLKQARKQLESNIEELDKLTSLSEGLLQLARLDHAQLDTSLTPVLHVIEQAVERVTPQAKSKKQKLVLGKHTNKSFEINQPAIVEALVTVLDNAVKYSPNNSEIKVSSKASAKYVEISIADKGVGIRSSDLNHIFERFYRADSSRSKTKVHGYGIGLSIAKSILEIHGGEITAKSTPGKVSTFTLKIPY